MRQSSDAQDVTMAHFFCKFPEIYEKHTVQNCPWASMTYSQLKVYLIEYAGLVYSICTQYEKLELDKIHHDAARIVSGAT